MVVIYYIEVCLWRSEIFAERLRRWTGWIVEGGLVGVDIGILGFKSYMVCDIKDSTSEI